MPARNGQPVAGRRLGAWAMPALSNSLTPSGWRSLPAGGLPSRRSAVSSFRRAGSCGNSPNGVTTVRDDAAMVCTSQKARCCLLEAPGRIPQQDRAHPRDYPSHRLEAILAASDSAPTARKWGLKDIAEYARANAHRITILQRAVSATSRSSFENPDLLYTCLELLASEYTEVKTGKADRNAFKGPNLGG